MKKALVLFAVCTLLLTGCGDKEVSASSDNLPTVTTNQGEAPIVGASP